MLVRLLQLHLHTLKHISKPGHIGRINADNQFDIVWASDGFIEPDPYLEQYSWFPEDVRNALVAAAG